MDVLEGLTLVLSALVFVIALGFLLFSRRTLPTTLLAVFLLSWSLLASSRIILSDLLGVSAGPTGVIYVTIYLLHSCALVAFAVVYPNLALTRLRAGALLAIVLVCLAVTVAIIRHGFQGGDSELLMQRLYFSLGPVMLIGLLLLGHRWLYGKTEAYRVQVLWGLLVFFFWGMHDGGTAWTYQPILQGADWFSFWFSNPYYVVFALSAALSAVCALALAGIAWARLVTRRARLSDRAFALIAPFLLAATLPQVFIHGIHIPLDFVAAGLVIYGVARFNVVDLDIRLKWGLSRGFAASVAIAAFFIVSELAKLFIETIAGSAVLGIMAAGVFLLFFAPLQHGADVLAQRAMPRVVDGEAYRDYRRYQIYRVALEGVLQDGIIEPAEAKSLMNLRGQLGITQKDHEALEQEVRAALTGTSARSTPPIPMARSP